MGAGCQLPVVLNIRSNMIFSLDNQVFYLLLDLLKFLTISIICIGSCHSCHFRFQHQTYIYKFQTSLEQIFFTVFLKSYRIIIYRR